MFTFLAMPDINHAIKIKIRSKIKEQGIKQYQTFYFNLKVNQKYTKK